jgi:hypothetical protein
MDISGPPNILGNFTECFAYMGRAGLSGAFLF